MNKLAVRIKDLRENLKDENSMWTQKYVAEQIGVARVTYTAYENGTKTPPPDIIKKLAALFGVTTDYILGSSFDPTRETDDIDPEFQRFMDEVRVWYKDEPKTKEEKIRIMRKMFEVFKNS